MTLIIEPAPIRQHPAGSASGTGDGPQPGPVPAQAGPGRAGWKTFTAVGAVGLAYLLVVAVRPGGAGFMVPFADWSFFAAALFASVCAGLTSYRALGSTRYGWGLVSAGMACWTLGQLGWNYYELFQQREVPFPSVADVGYLLSIPLVLAGTALLITARRGKVRTVLDGLIISASLFYVSWAFVLEPIVHDDHGSGLGWAVGLTYPIGRVATLSMAVIALGLVHPAQRRAVGLLALGMFSVALSAGAYAYLINSELYAVGRFVDAGWVGGFLLMGLGALSARVRQTGAERTSQASAIWFALPYAPLALGIVTSVILTVRDGRTGVFLHLLGVVIVLLVIARQLVSIRDNLVLTHRLGTTVNELSAREDQLRYLAFHDPLTGLANRALFHDRAEHALARQDRVNDPLAVLYIDLDGFKKVNDELGHAAGDALLTAVAARLRDHVRASDTLARIGGDEFVVLAETAKSDNDIDIVAERIVRALEPPFDLNGRTARITASVGVALRTPASGDVDDLLRRADNAMYAAKLAGKGRHVIQRS